MRVEFAAVMVDEANAKQRDIGEELGVERLELFGSLGQDPPEAAKHYVFQAFAVVAEVEWMCEVCVPGAHEVQDGRFQHVD